MPKVFEGVCRHVGHVNGPNGGQSTVLRNVFRRIQRLEARVAATTPGTIEIRVLLVHPELGATGVIVFGADNSTAKVPPTGEEVERVRADLERRREARRLFERGRH